ncbi:ORF69 [Felid gammaherpesvirus 1]|uniref:ORF69 n=1 Tax=Felid gammaherpesvirus 1 TaxID=2560468 RepID=A0A0M4M164_9GAMA|nr:ORF69 [Felis catus gammaherpesvirus 1]ALE14785.1 ORF69 [Felis catus gammaherpesvirus 1]
MPSTHHKFMSKISNMPPSYSKSTKSKKSQKSYKSNKSKSRRHLIHPYKSYTGMHCKTISISHEDFFYGISANKEFGRDFLREMDTPICTSSAICLPVDINQVAPGRCILLSPFGHTANMGFYCNYCSQTLNNSQICNFNPQPSNKSMYMGQNEELCSVALSFYNNAEKVVQHKGFYLSLLSNSMHLVKQSFKQPSLFYGYLVLKTFYQDIIPLFKEGEDKTITMYVTFKMDSLHIGETCLRLLTDNIKNYKIIIDCIKQVYVIKIFPQNPEEKTPTIPENSICDAVAALDFTDELKQELINSYELIAAF